ncbi:alpha/beta fold hydrolase [Aeromicrobium sp. Leaf350]|uniref:alpha/beta fold hydrolase n=1 Tax=Aeromicrobium sp. Leaf350 TaxID=2876565 RepID=UPI001E2C16C7|nr:alpha/beta fold hydrolase [Aeromicrobium sp. Leaf350]
MAVSPVPHVVERGSGTPVLFIHGNGVDHRILLDLDPAFEAAGGWQRLHLDLPGFGRTAALDEPGGLPELADWVDGAASSLLGDRPFAVVGSSMGGLLARDLAVRRPQQCLGLALFAPVVDPVASRRTLPPQVVLTEDPDLLASLDPDDAADYAEMAVVQSPADWDRFRAAVLPGIRAADERAMDRLGRRYELVPHPDARLAGFDRPVLVVAGRQDAVVGFEDQRALADSLPHATYAVLDRAGHNVHLDQPDQARALLSGWIAAVRATAG